MRNGIAYCADANGFLGRLPKWSLGLKGRDDWPGRHAVLLVGTVPN
jgi:hypothetical protein